MFLFQTGRFSRSSSISFPPENDMKILEEYNLILPNITSYSSTYWPPQSSTLFHCLISSSAPMLGSDTHWTPTAVDFLLWTPVLGFSLGFAVALFWYLNYSHVTPTVVRISNIFPEWEFTQITYFDFLFPQKIISSILCIIYQNTFPLFHKYFTYNISASINHQQKLKL